MAERAIGDEVEAESGLVSLKLAGLGRRYQDFVLVTCTAICLIRLADSV